MEVDGVKKEDYWKVVDQCYLCDLCYMTKCPYVPPHPWNVDFPHVMLRAKAIKFKKGAVKLPRPAALLHRRDGQARRHSGGGADGECGQPQSRCARRDAERARRAQGPRAAAVRAAKFRSSVRTSRDFPVKDGKNTPGKVAIFSTCYVNYNEPGMGHDLLAILEHNEIPYVLVEKEACCGMPKLELGDLEACRCAESRRTFPCWRDSRARATRSSTPVPSCTLMFKQELPLMYPGRPGRDGGARRDVRSVRVLRAARQGRLAEDGLQGRRWARCPTTSPAIRACRTWARRRARCWSRCRAPR